MTRGAAMARLTAVVSFLCLAPDHLIDENLTSSANRPRHTLQFCQIQVFIRGCRTFVGLRVGFTVGG